MKIHSIIDLKQLAIASSLFVLLYSCSSEPGKEGEGSEKKFQVEEEYNEASKEEMEKQAKKFFQTVPSPSEVIGLVKSTGAGYREDLLNSPDRAAQYSTNQKMAMNLGVYGADLTYASIFDQAQQSIFLLTATEKLAKGLGIAKSFGAQTAERLEANINNNDSILQIISENYWSSNTYLEENERHSTAALIISGGWIEVLYIATNLVTEKSTPEIQKRIAEQKMSLDNLLVLVSAFENDPDVKEMLSDLRELRDIYDEVKIEYTEAEPTKETSDDGSTITVINTTSEVTMTEETLKKIADKVAEIRNKMVSV